MIGAALPTPALPAQASSPADGAPQDAAATGRGDARKSGQAGAANGGGAAANAHAPHDAQTARDDRHFARLLAPDPAPAAGAPTAMPAAPTAPEQSAGDPRSGQLPDQQSDQLPDQLLDLFALLVPNAAPATAATAPATGAQTGAGGSPAPTGAVPQSAAVLAGRAVATEPGAAAVAGAPAAAAHAALAHGPGTPAPAADAAGPSPLALPAGTPPSADGATGTDAFTRLVAEAVTGHERLQADPAAAQPLSPTAPAASAAARPAVPPHAPLPQPADPGAGYGDDFGKGVLWMTEKALGHAQLRVTPDHLGPIDVRLQLDGARVHAEFSSAQPEVRQALEASLPRLREMLGQHGLELAQADVGQRQQDPRPRPGAGREAGGPESGIETQPIALPPRRLARGLLDEYA